MTREEAIDLLDNLIGFIEDNHSSDYDMALKMAIEALEQESRKDEVILTKEEYGELVSSEFDNGYAKGYREALEQESILDKIRAEIDREGDYYDTNIDQDMAKGLYKAVQIIDRKISTYKGVE